MRQRRTTRGRQDAGTPPATVAAEIVDMLTLHPEARRKVVRILAEVDAAEG